MTASVAPEIPFDALERANVWAWRNAMFSQRFQSEIDGFADALRRDNPLLTATRAGRVGPNAIAAYIATLGYLLRHNIPTLAMAREYALMAGKRELANYFDKKVTEERGHYRWAEHDLVELGSAPARPQTELVADPKAFVDDLRDALAENPTAFLSYVVCAEYVTVILGAEWVELLESRCNIPRTSVSAVDKHVELDKHHADEGIRMLDVLVQSDEDQAAMHKTLRRFMDFIESLTTQVAGIPN